MTSCPACNEPSPDGANWCEACGADLAAEPAATCVSCGRSDISADGYCMSCGHKQPAERDHVELVDGTTVAVSDRGLRHRHNEDAVAIAELHGGNGAVLVVCDGVSSTPGSAEASAAAAAAARDVLVAGLGAAATGGDSGEVTRIEPLLLAATDAAQTAATASPHLDLDSGPPSSTFVAVVARSQEDGLRLDVVWLGDSRAYWLDDRGAAPLTQDHELEGSLTRWLGADSGRVPPGVATFSVDRGGMLLVCSDGLWRYADPAPELHALVGRLVSEEGASDDLTLARELVRHALDGGGHDNISVALWSSPPLLGNRFTNTRK